MAVTAIQGPLVKRQIHNRRALVVLPALTAVPASPVLLAHSVLPVLLWVLVFCIIYHWLAPRIAVAAIPAPLVKMQIHIRRVIVVLPALTAVPASPVLLALSVLPVLLVYPMLPVLPVYPMLPVLVVDSV
jgi:hypothetical protein